MDIVKIGNGIGLTALTLVLVACGGSGGESANMQDNTPVANVSTPIEISAVSSVEKARHGEKETITVEASASNGAELKLASISLRNGDADKCVLIDVDGLSYTFEAANVGECQFNYEVVPVSSDYSGSAQGKTRVAVSQLLFGDNATRMTRSTTDTTDTATRALTDTVLPIISKAYFYSDSTPTIDLVSELSAYDLSDYTIESISVLGKLANSFEQFTVTDKSITLPALLPAYAGFSRIEYSLTNSANTETKIAWIDISISNGDGTNHNPSIATDYQNYTFPNTLSTQTGNEVIFNVLLQSEAPASDLVVIDETNAIPEVTLYILSDPDDGDVLSVINDTTANSYNLLGIALYAGTAEVVDVTNTNGDVIGSKILVDINRGGSHTMSYTVSDGQGGFVVGLISFRLPVDIFYFGQVWYNITIDTNTAGLDAEVAEGVLKSTGNRDIDGNVIAGADEITFTAPLATQLAFYLDVDFKNVFVEQGGINAMGPEGYAITTYSYEQAVKYCSRRGGRLPTINEMKLLTAKQGDNLYLDYAAPYTKAHNWPTSKSYWVAKRFSVEKAYVFDLNGGTGESEVDTGDERDSDGNFVDFDDGNYATCVLFDEDKLTNDFQVIDYFHSTENSIDFNAYMQFKLIDPEFEPAPYETMTVSADYGHFAAIVEDVSQIRYSRELSYTDNTQVDGMMYFFYNRCVLPTSGSTATCEANSALTDTLLLYMGDDLKHIYAYSNADSGDSTAPLAVDIYNIYASVEEGTSNVTIHVPDTTNPLNNRSIIRAPLTGGNLGSSTHNGGTTLWEANSTTDYQGVWLYRYPMTGKNFNMVIALNECPSISTCTPGTSKSSITIGLQQGFLPTYSDDIFTSESEIAGTRSYFFPSGSTATSKLSPAVQDSKNLMFNIQRSGANIDFSWQNTTQLLSANTIRLTDSATTEYPNLLGPAFNQSLQYYWLDYNGVRKELRLYTSNTAVKPDDNNPDTNEFVKLFENVEWGDLDPTQPYYFVIGYYSDASNNRNKMLLNTVKYKSWD